MRADLLHVIAVISNPERWKSRIALYRAFELHMQQSGVHLITVEHAFGDRPFEVTDANNTDHVQVRGGREQEIWLKEPLINLGIRQNLTRRFPDWKYVAWIDADIQFLRLDWAAETVHELQHVPVCQPWSNSIDLGPQSEILPNEAAEVYDRSFAAAMSVGEAHVPGTKQSQNKEWLGYQRDLRQHYGYAWAMTRAAYDGIGGLLDWALTGPADYHMAYAFAGMEVKADPEMHPAYTRRLGEFHDRSQRVIRGSVGVVHGTIAHGFHGTKKKRGYVTRRSILTGPVKYNPDTDLAYDAQGLPYLCTDNRHIRDGLRKYFLSRCEDSIDV